MMSTREPSPLAIEVRALAKTFPGRRRGLELVAPWKKPTGKTALLGIDVAVRAGEIVALLGPNGAGKTTLLEILATLIRPTSGEAFVDGVDVVRAPDRAREHVGYVIVEERSFFWRLSARENLRFFAALEGMHGKTAERRILEVVALLGLREQLDVRFMELSSGQKQRMAIARGLLPDPPVLLFDEATRSLDPGRAERVRRIVRELLVEKEKKTILFATHDLAEARSISDRVMLIVEGRVAAEGTFDACVHAVTEAFEGEARRDDEEFARVLKERSVRRDARALERSSEDGARS